MLNKAKITSTMPEISIIIPTYNRSELLCEAIESVLKQDFTDYEIIIVDDGSTNETQKTVSRYGNRLRYIYQPRSGVSNARNTGIKTAAANFIAFLDSDDLWEPKKLSTQWEFFQKNPDAYICYTKERWLRNKEWVESPRSYRPEKKSIFPDLLERCYIGASSVMIRKELFDLIGYFDESMPVCEDLDLWLRIAIKYPIYLIDETLTVKRMGKWTQLSTSIWGMDRYRIYTLEKLLKTNNLNSSQKQLFLSAIHKKADILAKGSLKHNHQGLALKYGWKWLKSINIQK